MKFYQATLTLEVETPNGPIDGKRLILSDFDAPSTIGDLTPDDLQRAAEMLYARAERDAEKLTFTPETFTPEIRKQNMNASDEIEQQIQARGLTAPRVTPADVESAISSEFFFTAHDGARGAVVRAKSWDQVSVRHDDNVAETPLKLLTFCVLVLQNGFTVTGESACASPENFDEEIGRKIARQNAVAKIWPLLGYALKQHLKGANL